MAQRAFWIKRDWTQAPESGLVLSPNVVDWSKALALIAPSQGEIELLKGEKANSDAVYVDTHVGRAVQFSSGTGSASHTFPIDRLHPSDYSLLLLISHDNLTSASNGNYGFAASVSNRALLHLPWTDDVTYFDYGNNAAGRVSATLAQMDYGVNRFNALCFIAGVGRREIWSNGRLVSSTTSSANITPGSGDYRVGNVTGQLSRNHKNALTLVTTEVLSRGTAQSLTENPWQLFQRDSHRIIFDMGGDPPSPSPLAVFRNHYVNQGIA